MEALTISRIVFLLFIVVLSVYFLFLNKNLEHFEEQQTLDTQKVTEIVKSTYTSTYKREATDKEIAFFLAYNIEKKPTKEELVQTITSSADIIEKSYQQDGKKNLVLDAAYGTEDEVNEIFNAILNRNPDEDEMLSFAKQLKEDKDFNLEKLKQVLYASEEYQRLIKTQSNLAYSNLVGGVTDRQITLIVSTNYKQVVGKETIDPDELHFLKKKLVEFNLDEAVFRKFLEYYIKNQPFNQQMLASEKVKQFDQQKAVKVQQEALQQQQMDQMKKELYSQVMSDIKAQSLLQQKTNEGYTTQTGAQLTEVQAVNKQVTDALLRAQEKENYLDSSDVLDTIKKEAKCVFDKNAGYQENQQSMAALIADRNKTQLKDTCVRNRTYLGLDEDMVLDPSLRWSIPQRHPPVCVGSKNDYQPTVDQTALIGTLLQDAKNTKVGNIVSPIPPK